MWTLFLVMDSEIWCNRKFLVCSETNCNWNDFNSFHSFNSIPCAMPWVVIRIEESKDAEAEVRPATSRANANTQHTAPSSPICGVYQKRMKMNQCSTPIPATNRPTAINEVELWPGWPGALCCPWSVVWQVLGCSAADDVDKPLPTLTDRGITLSASEVRARGAGPSVRERGTRQLPEKPGQLEGQAAESARKLESGWCHRFCAIFDQRARIATRRAAFCMAQNGWTNHAKRSIFS